MSGDEVISEVEMRPVMHSRNALAMPPPGNSVGDADGNALVMRLGIATTMGIDEAAGNGTAAAIVSDDAEKPSRQSRRSLVGGEPINTVARPPE